MPVSTSVQVGRQTFAVDFGADFDKTARVCTELSVMNARLSSDAVLGGRQVEDDTFVEFYSPALRAKKLLGQKKKPEIPEFPYYVSRKAPWVRVLRDGEADHKFEVMYDSEEGAEAGSAPGKGRLRPFCFYPAEYLAQNERWDNEIAYRVVGHPVEENVRVPRGRGRRGEE